MSSIVEERLIHDYHNLTDKLSKKIGFYWWRRYVAGAFWSNIESPLNLTLTLISTVISAQASTSSFMEQRHYIVMTFVSVILSTINTFYRPLNQVSKNIDLIKSWYDLGNDLERIYFLPKDTEELLRLRNKELHDLLVRVNQTIAVQSPANQNFFTDFIHIIARATCIRSKEPWLSFAQEDEQPKQAKWWCCWYQHKEPPVRTPSLPSSSIEMAQSV